MLYYSKADVVTHQIDNDNVRLDMNHKLRKVNFHLDFIIIGNSYWNYIYYYIELWIAAF